MSARPKSCMLAWRAAASWASWDRVVRARTWGPPWLLRVLGCCCCCPRGSRFITCAIGRHSVTISPYTKHIAVGRVGSAGGGGRSVQVEQSRGLTKCPLFQWDACFETRSIIPARLSTRNDRQHHLPPATNSPHTLSYVAGNAIETQDIPTDSLIDP